MTDEIKRSVTIAGHRTSISLERPFWNLLKELACSEKTSVNDLVRRIDAERGGKGTLSAAVRLYVLEGMRRRSDGSCTT